MYTNIGTALFLMELLQKMMFWGHSVKTSSTFEQTLHN